MNSNKKHHIVITKIYKYFSITLLILILFLGVLYKNVNGIKKCEKVNIIKKTIINPNIVFFGDSITDYYDLDKFFPNVKKVNSGISGNRTWDLKKDMYNRVYRYNPSKVIILIGINNLLYEDSSVEDIEKDIKEIMNDIHKELPNTEILLQSIYPINDDWRLYHRSEVPKDDVLTKKIVDINTKLESFCKKNDYQYIDVFKELSDDDCKFKKEYTDDGLHPNDKGYEVVSKILKKYM